jgi:hypothetical protein
MGHGDEVAVEAGTHAHALLDVAPKNERNN